MSNTTVTIRESFVFAADVSILLHILLYYPGQARYNGPGRNKLGPYLTGLFPFLTMVSMSIYEQPLHVVIKRIDPTLPLPTYATVGSVAFDLLCREETEIGPRELGRIPGNVIVQTPPGYMLLLAMRSSTPQRKGLLIPHGMGIIDQDYCGEGDELKVQVYNFRDEPVSILRGERIAQGMFVPVMRVVWDEVETMGTGRGGFGSTGTGL